MTDPLVIVVGSLADADAVESWRVGARAARPGLRVRRDGVAFHFDGPGAPETVATMLRWLAGLATGVGLSGPTGDA